MKIEKYIIIGLILANLIPVWAFKFVPTQDGINHVYNAYILKEYNNPIYTQYRQAYYLNIKPFPNWSSHAFFHIALHVMPPLIAEKLFVTIYMVLMPLSFFYFFYSIEKRLWFLGFLGFLYSYNVLFHLGFYNFAISVPFYFFTLGYWWKHRFDPNWSRGVILNLLLIATYFSHLFSFALLLVSIPLLSLTSVILPWQNSLKQKFWALLKSILYITPSYIILLICLLLNPEEKTSSYKPFKELWEFFISVKSLVYYNDRYVVVSWFLLGLICLCVLLTLGLKLWALIGRFRGRSERFFDQRDGFFLLFAVLTLLYFKVPWSYGPPAWINDRVNLFLFPVLAAWFTFGYYRPIKQLQGNSSALLSLANSSDTSPLESYSDISPSANSSNIPLLVNSSNIPPLAKGGRGDLRVPNADNTFLHLLKIIIAIIIIALSISHLSLTIYDYNLLNKDMKEFTSGKELISGDSSVSIITNDYHYAENHGSIKYLSPFYHDTCYYCFGNGSHYAGNYEPKYAYFPIHYREGYWKFEYKGTIDYMLVWNVPDNDPQVVELEKSYDLIHKTKNLKLFRHRAVFKK